MRTLAKTALALGFIGATVIGTTAAVQAQGFYFGFGYPHSYYRDYDDYRYGPPHYYGYGPRYYGYRSPCRPGRPLTWAASFQKRWPPERLWAVITSHDP